MFVFIDKHSPWQSRSTARHDSTVFSGFLGHQRLDLLSGHPANLNALRAASIAAENSSSGLLRFQKLRQEFHQSFIGAVFHRRSLKPHFQRSTHLSGDFIFARSRLHAHGKNRRIVPFLNLHHPAPCRLLILLREFRTEPSLRALRSRLLRWPLRNRATSPWTKRAGAARA